MRTRTTWLLFAVVTYLWQFSALTEWAKDNAAVRDVQQGPDGAIYVITDDNNGKILRIEPAK